MAIDPAQLNLVASLLIVLAGAYLWSSERTYSLWWFGTYSLAGLAGFVLVAVLSATSVEPIVILFAAALVLGFSLGSGSVRGPKLGVRAQGASAGAAAGYVLLSAFIALNYQWWIAPLLILLLILTGLTWNYVIPETRRLWAEYHGRGTPEKREETNPQPAAKAAPVMGPPKPAAPGPSPAQVPKKLVVGRPPGAMTEPKPSAAAQKPIFASCLACHALNILPTAPTQTSAPCVRCGATLLPKRPQPKP